MPAWAVAGAAMGAAAVIASPVSNDSTGSTAQHAAGTPLDLTGVVPASDESVYGQPKVLFVLGGPGAGKGTQCGRLVAEYGFTHLSAGDLLRAERANPDSADGELINAYIKEGNIVPVEITLRLLANAMKADGNTKFLIDGFPRSYDNLQGWQKHMDPVTNVLGVLFYDTDEEVMEKRILGRAATSGRGDDNVITIRKRFKVFKTQTMPVVEHYAHRGQVFVVNATACIEDVFTATQAIAGPIVEGEVLDANARLQVATAHADAAVIARLARGEAADVAAREAGVPGAVWVSPPVVTLSGPDSATVAYSRKVVPQGAADTDVTKVSVGSEVRSWVREAGKWVCVGVSRGDALLDGADAASVQWQQL